MSRRGNGSVDVVILILLIYLNLLRMYLLSTYLLITWGMYLIVEKENPQWATREISMWRYFMYGPACQECQEYIISICATNGYNILL